MRLRQSTLLGLLAISLTATGTGCASGTTAQAPSNSLFAEALAEAQTEGAGPEQVAALETAQAAGELTIEAAREAARRTVTCLADAGVQAELVDLPLPGGGAAPGYRVVTQDVVADDGTSATIQSCEERESLWVNQVFQMQPTSVQKKEDFANQQEPVLRACLEDKGVVTDPDATGVDLANQAVEASTGTGSTLDCLHEAGIDSW